MPKKLRIANMHLFFETVKMCYEKINRNNKDLERLEAWIEDTRIKLKKNLLVKQDKEDMNEQMYSYMHAILGPEIMSELDRLNEKMTNRRKLLCGKESLHGGFFVSRGRKGIPQKPVSTCYLTSPCF